MGDLFKSSSKQTTKTDMGPWGPQQEFLTDAFGAAQDQFRAKANSPYFEGPLHARLDPLTARALGLTADFATGAGANLANRTGSAADALLGTGDDFLGALDRFSGAAGMDPTEANLTAAAAYANNPFVNGMIDAASRDVVRNLTEEQLPDIDRAAVATGNVNSSRAGVAEGIARRGAEDRIADIGASIRGSAFDRGLEMAEGARRFNVDAQGRAAGMFGDALGMGRGFAGTASDLAFTNLGNLQKAGQVRQLDEQGQLDADFARWLGQDTRAADALARYFGIVGSTNFGQKGVTTTKTTQSMSPVQAAVGLGSMAAGFGAFGPIGGGLGGMGGFGAAAPTIGPSLLSGGPLISGNYGGNLVDLRGFRI